MRCSSPKFHFEKSIFIWKNRLFFKKSSNVIFDTVVYGPRAPLQCENEGVDLKSNQLKRRSAERSTGSHRTQMIWSGFIAVLVAGLALYQVFGKTLDSANDSTVSRLETRAPATIR
jgi:hypothetical protein